MILTKEHSARIESHLFNAQEERLELSRRQKDIIQRTPSLEVPGGHECGPSDPVGAAVAQLEKELKELTAWVAVTTETFERFRGTPKGSLMTMRYVEQLPRHRICKLLFVSAQTYYDWRQDILIYAAFQAVRRGVMQI